MISSVLYKDPITLSHWSDHYNNHTHHHITLTTPPNTIKMSSTTPEQLKSLQLEVLTLKADYDRLSADYHQYAILFSNPLRTVTLNTRNGEVVIFDAEEHEALQRRKSRLLQWMKDIEQLIQNRGKIINNVIVLSS
jgi:hypothetical protein